MAKDVLNTNRLSDEHEQVLSKVLTDTYKKPFFGSTRFWILAYLVFLILYVHCIYSDITFIHETSESVLHNYIWIAIESLMIFVCAKEIKSNYTKYKNEEK